MADLWVPKFAASVGAELDREFAEAAEQVAAGASIEAVTAPWEGRMYGAQLPMCVAMAMEGYKLAEAEFGKSAGLEELGGKAVDVFTQAASLALAEEGVENLKLGFADELLATKVQPPVEAWLRTVTKSITHTTLDRMTRRVATGIAEGLTVDELSRSLRKMGVTTNKARADMIARTSTIWSYNDGAQTLYRESGVAAKEWMVTEDDALCEFCAALDGMQVLIGESYAAAGSELTGTEGGTLGVAYTMEHPPAHPACRCVLLPVI